MQASLSDFEKDMRDGIFLLRPLPEQVFERAGQLSRRTTARLWTRTADLLHVAAALERKRLTNTPVRKVVCLLK